MRNFKNFSIYNPELSDDNPLKGKNIIFLKSEDGLDWYESQKLFLHGTLKLSYDNEGIVKDFSPDVTTLWPVNMSVAEIEPNEFTDSMFKGGRYIFADGIVTEISLTQSELIAIAEQKKSSQLNIAAASIAPLQDAVDLDIATSDERAQLLAWKKYRVLLNRVDTSAAPDIEWPELPQN